MPQGFAIGTILMRRTEARLFSDKQIELVKTRRPGGLIAIENVRLFNETKEALERQTATADILRSSAVPRSDVQPVFDAIVRSGRPFVRRGPQCRRSVRWRAASPDRLSRFSPEALEIVARSFRCGRPWETCWAGPP